jgi:2-keto-4-pentenoate hydratase/2-oxohepta-3-ene-1,7-dioic acid hydratase in catechol pathway
MKLARFEISGTVRYGVVQGKDLKLIEGDLFGDRKETGTVLAVEDAKLLAPCAPGKVIALGLNYPMHVAESKRSLPERPEPFFKAPSSICNPGDAIVIPRDAGETHFEGELVAVIGKTARKVSPKTALDYVLGYTCGNDVSVRPWQRGDLQWWRAKGSDTFAPLGPWIETDIPDPSALTLETRLNGEVKQQSGTDKMLFNVATTISYVSQVVTLFPGDVIYTGTCDGVGPMDEGDTVEVEISGIGVLRNPVERERD